MSKQNIGTCKLCQKKAKLSNSHIIPAFAYRRMLKGKGKQPHGKLTAFAPRAKYNKRKNPPTSGITEPLLCGECEQKLGNWETYVTYWLDGRNDEYPKVDYKKFKLFQLSIIWRLAISQNFSGVNIRNRDKERLRIMLLNNDAGLRYHYPCMLRKFKDGTVSNTMIGCDGSKNIGGIEVYAVQMLGYIWEFFIADQFTLMDKILVKNSGSEDPFLSIEGVLPIHESEYTVQQYINEITKEPLMQAAILQTKKNFKKMTYNPFKHDRKSIRLKGYDYARDGLYFVTICVEKHQCLFGKVKDDKMILNEIGLMVEKWWLKLADKFSDIELYDYVVMPNHFHGIITISRPVKAMKWDHNQTSPDTKEGGYMDPPLQNMVQWFKIMTTNNYIRNVKDKGWQRFNGRLWQRNYFEHIIRSEKAYSQIADYILGNPSKWQDDKYYTQI